MAERKLSHELTGLVKDVSLGFLAPIFFVTAGFQVSFAVFQTDLVLLLTVIVLATLGKIVGTALFYLPSGYGWREGVTVGAGMNGRGAVEIVIAGIGLQAGIITQEIFSILVFMAISTTATVPIFLKWGVEWLRRRDELVRSSPGKKGVLIVGAGPVARLLGKALSRSRPVRMIDTNEENCRIAQEMGLDATYGDALEDSDLRDAGIAESGLVIGITPNAEVNVLVAKRAHEQFLVPDLHALLVSEKDSGLYRQLEHISAHPLYHVSININNWNNRVRNGLAGEIICTIGEDGGKEVRQRLERGEILPLTVERGEETMIFAREQELREGDKVIALE